MRRFGLFGVLLVGDEPLKCDYELKALAVDQISKEAMEVAVIRSLVKSQIFTVLVKQIQLVGHVLSDKLFWLGLELLLNNHIIPF